MLLKKSVIKVRGAREHNLKNIDLVLPHDQLIVITGPSGSGKSSLSFDTLYAEGQRRYVESLSAYARQFLELMPKPDVDHIEGLSPAIAIEQKTTSKNPRSTVGTVTEIYDYLRLLYARVGEPFSPHTGLRIEAQTVTQMVDQILAFEPGIRLYILAPIVRGRKGEYRQEIQNLQKSGFGRVRVDGVLYELDAVPPLLKQKKHHIEVVVDRIVLQPDMASRLANSLETALNLTQGLVIVEKIDTAEQTLFSSQFACPVSGFTIEEIEPRLFSFNSPVGACVRCDGLGECTGIDPAKVVTNPHLSLQEGACALFASSEIVERIFRPVSHAYEFSLSVPFQDLTHAVQQVLLYGGQKGGVVFEGIIPLLVSHISRSGETSLVAYQGRFSCPTCQGYRLKSQALAVRVGGRHIGEITDLSIVQAAQWFQDLKDKLKPQHQSISVRILKEIQDRLGFLVSVGLDYLTLGRSSGTLSGGESQRIRLASQIGSGLTGVLYVLDEPSIGLHQVDNDRLLATLKRLRDLGNTVIVVEHDEDAILAADHVVDMGPGAGILGGKIVAQGTPEDVMQVPESITGAFLTKRESIPVPLQRRKVWEENALILRGARANNLKNVTVSVPLGRLTCVTGVSGGGKSSLVIETLHKALINLVNGVRPEPGLYDSVEIQGGNIDKVIDIDQSPIGRTPRSNPATYTGLFTAIRDWFASLPEAAARGYSPSRFSFNISGGRCETCQGAGVIKVEMHFLPDIYVVCDQCQGKRYDRETCSVTFKGKSIADVLEMTVDQALSFFQAVPSIRQPLQMLDRVGLGYLSVGQRATTLSGGEAQRVKLAKELARRQRGNTFYILDEPTTGLHFIDIKKLMEILHHLVDQGHTVLIIEHNLEVIKTADWIIDMGPKGGAEGGQIIAAGTPEHLTTVVTSYTGQYLKRYL